ncbi:glycosyltransferase [Shewanella sp. OPT22]|nr:glycosyltransferase [Shewanella sp. OPT22]
MQKAKRVAIVINSLSGGGAEKVMLTLAMALQHLGHLPYLVLLQKKGEYDVPENIPYHACFNTDEKHLDAFWKRDKSAKHLAQEIRGIESEFGAFDLFLSNLDKTNMLMTKTDLSPLYCVVHNSVEAQLSRQKKLGPLTYFKMLYAKKSMSNQNLICVSNGIANEINEVKRFIPKSIRTIYNPFDLQGIQRFSNEDSESIPKSDFLIHVGRVAKQKRHDILFSALKLTKSTLPLVLLCNNPKKAMKLAKQHGVEDRVIIPGFQTNPYAWIKRAKAMVLSSDFEGLPTVLIEALACGTPVVSTDCPHGPSEILTDELSQYLVPVRQPKLLAEKIDLVLKDDPDISNVSVLGQVNAENVAKAYLSLIQS